MDATRAMTRSLLDLARTLPDMPPGMAESIMFDVVVERLKVIDGKDTVQALLRHAAGDPMLVSIEEMANSLPPEARTGDA